MGTTQGSSDGDTVTNVQSFSLEELKAGVDTQAVWSSLSGMLQHVLAETYAAEGTWTLKLQKPRGAGTTVSLLLSQGWDGAEACEAERERSSILERIASFFNESSQ